MNNKENKSSERRTYFRIAYPPTNRPKLFVGKYEFEIADISEGGLRFINNQKIELETTVRGTTTFLCGESMDIEGNIVWQQNSETGLLLKDYISPATMEKEKQFVILKSS